MYFGPDHHPVCDEVCTNCDYTSCVDNPHHKDGRIFPDDYPPKKCAVCGENFIPTSPGQKYCSPEENPECDYERTVSKMTPLQYIRFHGYKTKEEFINDQGEDAWQAIQNNIKKHQ